MSFISFTYINIYICIGICTHLLWEFDIFRWKCHKIGEEKLIRFQCFKIHEIWGFFFSNSNTDVVLILKIIWMATCQLSGGFIYRLARGYFQYGNNQRTNWRTNKRANKQRTGHHSKTKFFTPTQYRFNKKPNFFIQNLLNRHVIAKIYRIAHEIIFSCADGMIYYHAKCLRLPVFK